MIMSIVCIVAIDLTYGVILCFSCQDYVYDEEVDEIARREHQRANHSLGLISDNVENPLLINFFHYDDA